MTGPVWPIPEPDLPPGTSALLATATRAAVTAFRRARGKHSRAELAEQVQIGADGTPTTRLDLVVDNAVSAVASQYRVNLISEEIGVLDHGSALTLIVDPVDGTANATAGVPLATFAAALARDEVITEAITCWLDTGRCWHTMAGQPSFYRTSGRRELDNAAVSLLRPHAPNHPAWWRIAQRAGRVRILSSSCLEAALVAEGATDAFADAGTDTHRIMDLAAAMLTVPAGGGAVLDAFGRPLEISTDLSLRWSGVVAATQELAEQIASEITEDNRAEPPCLSR